MKYSRQREFIEQAVVGNTSHPTADDVYRMLKPENPALSLGTVYRNLNALADIGAIKKINMPKGSDRFDGKISPHYHAICDRCDKVFDVELPFMQQLSEEIMNRIGAGVTAYHLIINCVCSDCTD